MSVMPIEIVQCLMNINKKYHYKYYLYTTFNGVLTQIYNQLNNNTNIIIISVLKEIEINNINIWEIKDFYINKSDYPYTLDNIIKYKDILNESTKKKYK